MCGIAGFIDRNAEQPLATLGEMGETLRHRGPDDHGVFFDEKDAVGLAHRRLSIIDLSSAGRQPMESPSGRYVISYNGEIYNYRALAATLPRHEVIGASDTAVFLACVDAWGLTTTLERAVGMFALALFDRQERKLILVRDRFGEKPLYYGRSGGAFLFASELKAIRRHGRFDAAVDPDVVALFLAHNYVPDPYCIYKGFSKVAPGTFVTIDPRDPAQETVARYWEAGGVADATPVEDAEAIDRVRGSLSQSVRDCMVADVPLGAFLSGGIDSSLVVALMQEHSSSKVQTFTIGFQESGFDEAPAARRVAGTLGTDHTELYVSPQDSLEVIPNLVTMYDEPFADSSQIPTHLVSALGREKVTVALSGDGADEIFGGYDRYRWSATLTGKAARWGTVSKFAGAAITRVDQASWDRFFSLINPLLPPSKRQVRAGERLHRGAALLGDKDVPSLYSKLMSYWGGEPPLFQHARLTTALDDAEGSESDPLLWMMLRDSVMYLPSGILTKVDRASMAVSLEVRAPFLDHRLAALAWSLPMNFKIRGGTGKWILKEILGSYLPTELFDRPKMGFGVPVGEWLRGPLRPWAEDLLTEEALASEGLLDVERIRRAWLRHESGTAASSYELWGIVTLQAWLRGAHS